jgi:predicted amidohydrolase YtcJ
VFVGSTDGARAALPEARHHDLDGRAVLPAFIDSHTHFHRAAVLSELYLDFEALRPTNVGAVLALVAARASERPAGDWIQGDSITGARLAEGRLPDRHELDAAAPDHPVLIRGIGKHVVTANSRALALAGIGRDTPDPPGGRIERDADGEPTGILHERAKLRLDASAPDTVVPAPDAGQRLDALRAGITRLHRMGIATIHEMVRQGEEAADIAALHAAGELGVRVRLYYRVWESRISLEQLIHVGIRRGWGDDQLRVGGVKVSVDGWCIFRNAAVHEPYRDEPENVGVLRIEPSELQRIVVAADRAGLGVAVHAVGARAVDAALDAFAAALPAWTGPHRIEHAHLDLDAERIERIRSLGLVLSAQPGFLGAYDADWRAGLDDARVARMMPLGSVARAGIPLLINSDMPSGPAGPLATIAAAVRRRADVPGDTAEALSLAEAWAAHSLRGAEVTHEPHLGRLEPGSRADLIVLAEDPFRDGADIPSTVEATLVDGRIVHDTLGWRG